MDRSSFNKFNMRQVASVVNCRITPRFESAPFGEVVSGELLIRGHLKIVALDPQTRQFHLDHNYDVPAPKELHPQITIDDPSSFWDSMHQAIWCLLIIREDFWDSPNVVYGLVLINRGSTNFERAGWFTGGMEWFHKEQSEDSVETDVLIV